MLSQTERRRTPMVNNKKNQIIHPGYVLSSTNSEKDRIIYFTLTMYATNWAKLIHFNKFRPLENTRMEITIQTLNSTYGTTGSSAIVLRKGLSLFTRQSYG